MHSTESSAARLTYLGRAVLAAAGLAGVGLAGPAGAQRMPSPGETAVPGVTAFVNVAVVPMDRERVLAGQTVVVRGDRIVALGPAAKVRVPAGATRVDGRGKYLLPGLADMHVHIGYTSGQLSGDSTLEKTLFLYLANGVTTVRDMHSGRDPVAPTRGLGLRRRVEAGTLLGPRIYTAGDPDLSSPAAAAQTTAALQRDGYDFVKIDVGSTPMEAARRRAVYDSILAAAHRVGLRVVGHAPPGLPLREVLAAHWASTEHLYEYPEAVLGLPSRFSIRETDLDPEGNQQMFANIAANLQAGPYADTAAWRRPGYRLDGAKLRALAAAVRRAGVWNCPTLDVDRSWYDGFVQAFQADSAAVIRLGWRGMRSLQGQLAAFDGQLTKALQDAGAGLLLGTDLPEAVPAGVHRELALLVEAGLTPYQALATGTRQVAAFLGTRDSTGTVAVGKRADLVLLGANPLRDVGATRRLAGVMRGGRWFSRAAIDSTLDAWQPSFSPGDLKALRALRDSVWRTP